MPNDYSSQVETRQGEGECKVYNTYSSFSSLSLWLLPLVIPSAEVSQLTPNTPVD